MGSLSDWLARRYDPSHVAWHFLNARDWDISDDFEVYCAITDTLTATVDYAPQPNLDRGFWVKRMIDGEIASIGAARQYVINHSIEEEIPRMMPGATTTAPSGEHISGNVVFIGGIWTNPAFRRSGLAVEACNVLFGAAMLLWDPDYFMAVAEESLSGLSRREGFVRLEPVVIWQDWTMNLCWLDRRQALLNIAGRLAQAPS